MRIAVNARCLTHRTGGCGYYTYELVQRISRDNAEHDFLLLSDRPLSKVDLAANVSTHPTGTPVNNFIAEQWWLNVKVTRILKRWKADVFISLDGSCCLNTKVPQVLWFTDLQFLSGNKYLLSKYLEKVSRIIVPSQFIKETLTRNFPVAEAKCAVIPKAAKETFQPVSWEQREAVKSQYTSGKEFFLFTGGFGAAKNLLNVLKAFSHFKKWQLSEMKLVVTGDTSYNNAAMMEKLRTFKFRDDVVLLNIVPEDQFAMLMAAAYALLHPPLQQCSGLPVLEALQTGTPVITSGMIAKEIAGNAVIYADADDATDIGTQMIRLYKDEDLRHKLGEEGKQHALHFSWNRSAAQLWQEIEKAAVKASESRISLPG